MDVSMAISYYRMVYSKEMRCSAGLLLEDLLNDNLSDNGIFYRKKNNMDSGV